MDSSIRQPNIDKPNGLSESLKIVHLDTLEDDNWL